MKNFVIASVSHENLQTQKDVVNYFVSFGATICYGGIHIAQRFDIEEIVEMIKNRRYWQLFDYGFSVVYVSDAVIEKLENGTEEEKQDIILRYQDVKILA